MMRTILFCLLAYVVTASADDPKKGSVRITANEPVAIIRGTKAVLKIRGFKLNEAMELRFPNAQGVTAEIKEKKESSQPPGLDNKIVGDSQVLAEISLPADLPEGPLDYVVVTPAGEAIGKIKVLSTDSAAEEKEPNNGFKEATKLQLGISMIGTIKANKDVDVYELLAKAGKKWKVTVTCGGAFLMDAAIHCYSSDRQFLAAADDGETRDPVLIFSTSVDGPIYLCVSDAHDIGDEWHSYLLVVEEVQETK